MRKSALNPSKINALVYPLIEPAFALMSASVSLSYPAQFGSLEA